MSRLTSILCVALGATRPGAVGAERPAPPAAALARLETGNGRFPSAVSGDRSFDLSRRAALVQTQAPFATVVSCADARVPPEVIFDAALGDLFVVRVAGGAAAPPQGSQGPPRLPVEGHSTGRRTIGGPSRHRPSPGGHPVERRRGDERARITERHHPGRVAEGRVEVVGGYYELSTGRVHFSSVVGVRDVSTAR
jgi:hypothetical protein